MNLSQSTYFTLVQKFLATVNQSITKEDFEKQEGIVQLATDELVLRLLPHGLVKNEMEPGAAIIEVDLMSLDLDQREINHDRFLILHQLNAMSRLTTGIVAFIDAEGMLSISKIIPLAGLDENSFSEEIGKVMDAAESLYDGWNHLADLVQEQESDIQEDPSDPSLTNSIHQQV